MRITRRELAALIAGTPAAARAAQAPPPPPEVPQPGPQAAVDSVRKNVAAVRELQVPFDTEPASVFRAQ